MDLTFALAPEPEAATGAQDFGVYAEVVAGGPVAVGDEARWI